MQTDLQGTDDGVVLQSEISHRKYSNFPEIATNSNETAGAAH